MDRDNTTRTGARAPGAERLGRSHGGVGQPALLLDPERGVRALEATRRSEANHARALIDRLYLGRPRLTGRPWSRTGENPPYGILGGTMETSASFEARSAPSSYPTPVRREVDDPRRVPRLPREEGRGPQRRVVHRGGHDARVRDRPRRPPPDA